MASSMQGFHLIFDFDGTIIKNDTIPLLDYLRQGQNSTEYSSFLKPYLRDYNEHIDKYRPFQHQRTTLQLEYDYLDSLSGVEKQSIERIESSGWLKGLEWTPEDHSVFDNAVSQIIHDESLNWRAGFADLVNMILDSGGIVDILSVNWSRNFIQALLKQEFGEAVNIDRITVYSNEIDPLGTGQFSRVNWKNDVHFENHWPDPSGSGYDSNRGIWTAQDKVLIMQAITASSRTNGKVVVYVGDSKTDLKCMMKAEIGIRVVDNVKPSSEQTSLSEVCCRLGIGQLAIKNSSFDRFVNEGTLKLSGRVVYFAQVFDEVREALLSYTR